MNIPSVPRPLLAAMLLSITVAPPAFAQAGHDRYRCSVLGDIHACSTLPAEPRAPASTRLVAGPYARYLMQLGRSPEQAIAEARRIGEEPNWSPVGEPPRLLVDGIGGLERYERLHGRAPGVRANAVAGLASHDAPTLR